MLRTAGIIGCIALLFLIALVTGLCISKEAAGAFSTAAVVATLGAVIWYSWETRKLRFLQQRDMEICHHPWLALKIMQFSKSFDSDDFGREQHSSDWIHFEVKNRGSTPAYNVRVHGRWVGEMSTEDRKEGDISFELGVILPNAAEVHDVCICEKRDAVKMLSEFAITVDVQYNDFMQGGGKFRCHHEDMMLNTCYEKHDSLFFWLSDGTRFPLHLVPTVLRGNEKQKGRANE